METRSKWERSLKDLEDEFRRLLQAMNLIVDLDRQMFLRSFDLNNLLTEMITGLKELTKANHAQILLRRGSMLEIVHSTQEEDKGKQFRIDKCFCGMAVEDRKTVASGDVENEYPDRYQWVLGKNQENRMASEVAVPIRTPPPEQVIAGVLNIESPDKNAFSENEIEMVEKFAQQASVAIHNVRVHDGLVLTLDLAELVHLGRLEPNEGLRKTLEKLAAFFEDDVIVQYLTFDKDANTLTIKSSNAADTEGLRLLVEESFSGLVIKERKVIRSNDVIAEHPQIFKDTVRDAGGRSTQSELAAPILLQDRDIIGVLNIESAQKGAFTVHDEYVLSQISKYAGLWERLEHQLKRTLALGKMATVGDVAGNMIHVLKNETARLGSTLKRLQEKRDAADPPLPIDDEIEGIRSVSAAIIARADQLKQRYERARREPQPTDVNSLVRRVVAEIVTRPDIEVDFDDLDEHMPKLMISPGFEDVVWNIISNAQAAIPEEQEGRIKIATKVLFGKYTNQMEGFQIVFTDNGIGMSEEKQDEIGKLGFSSKEGEGSGYGMWWLDTFVERWQGKKTLHSEVGKGTEISLWFPLTPEGVAIGLEGGQV
jgi:signal transduction histidine kinase